MTPLTVKSAVEPTIEPITNLVKGIYNRLTNPSSQHKIQASQAQSNKDTSVFGVQDTVDDTARQNENTRAYNDFNEAQRDTEMWARVAEGRNNQGSTMSQDLIAPPTTQPVGNQTLQPDNPATQAALAGAGSGLAGGAGAVPAAATAAGSGLAGGATGGAGDPGMLAQLGQFAGSPGGGAAIGAGMGGLYGALSGPKDEEDRRSWVQRALMPALIGGGLGAGAGLGMQHLAKAAAAEPTEDELGKSFEEGFATFLQQSGLNKEASDKVYLAFECADPASIGVLVNAYATKLAVNEIPQPPTFFERNAPMVGAAAGAGLGGAYGYLNNKGDDKKNWIQRVLMPALLGGAGGAAAGYAAQPAAQKPALQPL